MNAVDVGDGSQMPNSLAVEGLDLEKINIEANFVPKEVEFFVEQHIQNPLKSTLGKIFYWQLNFINFFFCNTL